MKGSGSGSGSGSGGASSGVGVIVVVLMIVVGFGTLRNVVNVKEMRIGLAAAATLVQLVVVTSAWSAAEIVMARTARRARRKAGLRSE